jgi:PAS domain S-box-containing protein/putative nucleotidyltransferase with HDIG domain
MKSVSQKDQFVNVTESPKVPSIRIWRWFTEPAPSIHEPERRRRAQLLSALLATLFLLGFFSILLTLFTFYISGAGNLYVAFSATLIMAVAYYLSRTTRYDLAALLMVGTLSASIFALEVFEPNPNQLYFLILSVLVSSLFLSHRYTTLVMAVNIIGIWVLSIFSHSLTLSDLVSPMFAILCVGVLGIVSITIRKQDLTQMEEQHRLRMDYIIQREQIETSLRESEKRFRALIEYSMEEVSLVSANGTLLYESPSKRRPLGYPPNSFVGRNILDLFHPEDRVGVVQFLEEIVGQPACNRQATFRLLHEDGSWRWMEGYVTNLLDEAAVHAIVINYRDVTERQQAEEELKRRLADFEAVNQLSGVMRTAHSIDELLPIVLDSTLEILHKTVGSLWLYDRAKDELRPTIMRGYDDLPADIPGEGIAGYVFNTGQTFIETSLPDSLQLPEALRRQISPGVGVVAVPVRAADKVIGTLIVSTILPDEFTAKEIHLLSTLSEIAGNAIQRTLFHQQTERRLQNLIALSEIDKAISSSFDLNTSLSTLLNHVVGQLGIDAADVLLFDANSLILDRFAEQGFRTRKSKRAKPRLDKSYAGQAIMDHEIVKIEDIKTQQDDELLTAIATMEGFVSYYAVPLLAKGYTKGVLEIFKRSELEPDDEWLDLLNMLAQQAAIAIDNANMFENIQRSNAELSLAYDATIEGWSHALDLRDKETEGHTLRVTDMTMELARAFDLSDAELAQVRWGALLHDIGKMGIPDTILHKPGSLTDHEWSVMRKHPAFAYDMLSPIRYLQSALDIPYCHHEKWDGTGYPRGLKGKQIPLPARIFAIVDVWDALTSDRPYRPAWAKEKALQYIQTLSGTHFDPRVVDMFLKMVG